MTARRQSSGLLILAAAMACAIAGLLGVSSLSGGASSAAAAQLDQGADPQAARRERIGAVNNWGYWLSSFEPAGVAAAPHDLLVIDSEISANRTFERELRREEVTRMQRRPDGRARLLLAYRSVGEAERYRPYWQQEWYDPAAKPAWLGKENRRWAGNFAVQFWQPEWQKLIFCSWCFTPYRPVLAGLDLSVFSSLIPGSIQLCFISCYRVG